MSEPKRPTLWDRLSQDENLSTVDQKSENSQVKRVSETNKRLQEVNAQMGRLNQEFRESRSSVRKRQIQMELIELMFRSGKLMVRLADEMV